METASEVVDYVVRGGLAVFLILVIVGGSRRWWVFGHTFDAMQVERDEWKVRSDELLTLAVKRALDERTETMHEDDAQERRYRGDD